MTENEGTEYKSEYSDSIPKTVVAFSNTSGGKISIGVDDSGNVIGLKDADEVARRCVQMLRDEIRPDVTSITSADVKTVGDKRIVEISVSEGPDKPYYLRNKGLRAESVYLRRGPSSVQSTESQFNAMVRSVKSKTYELTISLDQDLTFTYARNMFNSAGLPFDDVHMNILGIKTAAGYTNLGFLISDQCNFQIKAAVFTDKGRSAFRDRIEISGSLLKQFDDTMSFIRRHITVSSTINGLYRKDVADYPEEAVREIVLNAIIHRDYNSIGNTLVSMYDDSLEISSPGSMVEDIPESDLIKGASFPRNRCLSEIFYRLGLVEAYGTGIPRVMKIYGGSDKMPEFDISRSIFRVTLFSMSKRANIWEGEGTFTRKDIEVKEKVSKSKATQMLNQMIERGIILRQGNGKSARYKWV